MPEWTFPISPIAASRPRVSKHGAYFKGPYKRFRQEMPEIILDILGHNFKPIEGDLAVDLELVITRPKQTKLTAPRADIDNFVKAVFDSLNGYLWEDDRQILKLYAVKQWAEVGEEGYFTIGVDKLIYRDKR